MTNAVLRVVVLSDVHYASSSAVTMTGGDGGCAMGVELVRRVLEDARLRGGFDAVAILGDLLNDGTRPESAADLAALAATVKEAAGDKSVLLVPGNHDFYPDMVYQAFAAKPGVHEIKGCAFLVLADRFAGDFCTRSQADRQQLADLAASGRPVVVLQHNPIYPPVESEYPYMHTNNADILRDYAQAKVLASLSGHNHAGAGPIEHDGATYITLPALARPPHGYAMLEIQGPELRWEKRALKLDEPGLWDCHAHTQFAYCGEGISGQEVIERARYFGLAGVCLTEHAPQLYCVKEDFWSGRHIKEPELWRSSQHSRMAEFRAAMAGLRCPTVRIGLEVEVDKDGGVTLHDEDRDVADILVGAVHWLPQETAGLTDEQVGSAFLHANEQLLGYGVNILAHPLRVFSWMNRPCPSAVHRPLAKLLAETHTAAEINFHKNPNDPAFFHACLDQGVKISLGSDTHQLFQAGALWPHVEFLRSLAGPSDILPLLYRPQ